MELPEEVASGYLVIKNKDKDFRSISDTYMVELLVLLFHAPLNKR